MLLSKDIEALLRDWPESNFDKEEQCNEIDFIDKECNLLLKVKNNKVIKIIEGDVNIRY